MIYSGRTVDDHSWLRFKICGYDREYDFTLAPGQSAVISSTDYGYNPQAFHEVSLRLDHAEIVRTDGACLGDIEGCGVKILASPDGGVVFVAFAPELRTLSIPVRTNISEKVPMLFCGRSIGDGAIVLEGLGIMEFKKSAAADRRFLLRNLKISCDTPFSISGATFDGNALSVELIEDSPPKDVGAAARPASYRNIWSWIALATVAIVIAIIAFLIY